MGKKLFSDHKPARDVFLEVDEALNRNLSKIIFEGTDSELTNTYNAQPALMAVSLAIIRVIENELGKKITNFINVVAGHSLGEYSALCAIDSLKLTQTAKILELRGNSMQDCVSAPTKMTAILGMKIKDIEKCLFSEQNNICEIANDNCPGQAVISGHESAVNKTKERCKKKGARGLIDLNVSAPFHCSLMQPAADIMQKALENIQIKEPVIKFINNVNADFTSKPSIIKNLLIEQIVSKVRWRESIELIYKSGITNIYEVGSGKVLTGLNRRMQINCDFSKIEEINEIKFFLEKLK
tara:strand:+ start:497 stop:1387 length:891 start_codon:yes stop_codon:yes gene_type:complete